ncbi:hypothetical protein L6164_003743 [Bauhinia variegata]|uniref:Uncharacterized protein n=1 Tax=Bauhinia variegata TaxID=167791 RepID=A0ACB9Q2G8_BAUVA|nr:hypothetical protein L6164_003743 [Bauhinia variegata]
MVNLLTTDVRSSGNTPKATNHDMDTLTDLFGQGIFNVEGDKWKKQRKLASYEFSTRILRDFSCSVFRKNAANLDSIFKVGFGVELNCLEGSSKEGSEFMKAFDESNALVYWRYVDPFWKIKRFLNIGCEATLKKNLKLINDFVNAVIKTKREILAIQENSDGKEDILLR